MIICKIYVDDVKKPTCVITELAKHIPEGLCNVMDDEKELKEVKIFSVNNVAISKEARDFFNSIIDDPCRTKIGLDADFTWRTDFFDESVKEFSYVPNGGNYHHDSLRKKTFYVNQTLYILPSPYQSTNLMNEMPTFDNEFLKNLKLDKPYEN